MDDINVIEVDHVYKKFSTHMRQTTIKDMIVYHKKINRVKEHAVLNDISFVVKKGEVMGIIGRNGCGKSTMLKLLSRIIRPDDGEVRVNGKVACLIELGAGFHPDMTGRENVYINASIFGISKKLVDQRMEKIIEFSGIGNYIDERVRNYSSGMYLRLAFSVAINVDADILLVDEILAVGDIQFQKKCMDRLEEFRKTGGTIVLVTHNTEQAKLLCDKVAWIESGEIKMMGNPKKVCETYKETMMGESS